MTVRVVALDDYQGLVEQYSLAGRPDGAEWVAIPEHLTGDALVRALDGAAVIVAMRERTRFGRDLLAKLPDLKLLITTGMHNASIDLQAAAEHGVTVSGTSGPRTTNTAELAWALILSLVRHLPEEAASVREGGWQHTVGTDLLGSTLGLAGVGRIGHQMARIAQAFQMEVIAWSQHLDPAVADEAGVRAVSKEDLFATADVVSVHLMLGQFPLEGEDIQNRIADVTEDLCRAELEEFLPERIYAPLAKAGFQPLRDALSQLFKEWI